MSYTNERLEQLVNDIESDRAERRKSLKGDASAKIREAVCAFANDLPGHGVAGTLSKAKNNSVSGLVAAGILASKTGKVRLLRRGELPVDWDPVAHSRLTIWEMVHHLIRVLEASGEGVAAELATKLGSQAETARELAYRLYTLCERKKRAGEALSYNGLVQSWPEITRPAWEGGKASAEQGALFEESED